MQKEKIPFVEIGVISVVIFLLTAGTYWRNTMWTSPLDFQLDMVKKSPGKARPYTNLANAYVNAGIYDKALEASQKAIELDPKAERAYYNMSLAYQKLGELGQGYCHGEEGVGFRPRTGYGSLYAGGDLF